MMVDDDLKSILDDMVVWRKNYLNKCYEVRELSSQVDILKSELRISKESEQRMLTQLNRKQENVSQLQELLAKYAEEQDKNIKKNEENDLLRLELQKNAEIIKEERQNWEKEKIDILEKHKKELIVIREAGAQDVLRLQLEIKRLNDSNVNTMESLKKEVMKKEDVYKDSISQTVSHYEAELSKLNGDLSSAQSEIKQLRERCASNINMFRDENNMEIEKYVINAKQSKLNNYKIRLQPIPMMTAQSQLYNEHETSAKTKLQPHYTLSEQVSTKETVATNTSPMRKKKLYYHHNDQL